MTLAKHMSERELQQAIVDAAGLYRWLSYHNPDSTKSNPGFPDLVLVHPNFGIIYAELKTEKGRLRPDQIVWLDALARWNPHTYLLRPRHLDAMIGYLARTGPAPEEARWGQSSPV